MYHQLDLPKPVISKLMATCLFNQFLLVIITQQFLHNSLQIQILNMSPMKSPSKCLSMQWRPFISNSPIPPLYNHISGCANKTVSTWLYTSLKVWPYRYQCYVLKFIVQLIKSCKPVSNQLNYWIIKTKYILFIFITYFVMNY
jgi:hypothetical protein